MGKKSKKKKGLAKQKKQNQLTVIQTESTSGVQDSAKSKSIIPYKSFGEKLFDLLMDSKPKSEKKEILALPESKEESKPKNKKGKKLIISSISIVILLAGIFLVGAVSEGKSYPFVKISEQSLSYQTPSEIKSNIESLINSFQDSNASFTFNDQVYTIPVKDLGLKFDLDKTLSQVPYFDFKNNFGSTLTGFIAPVKINPIFQIDQAKFEKQLEQVINFKSLRSKNPTFYYDSENKLQITPPSDGLNVDKAKILADFQSMSSTLISSPILITANSESPTISIEELKTDQDKLIKKSKTTLNLVFNSLKIKFTPHDYLSKVSFNKSSSGEIIFDLKPEFFEQELNEMLYSKIEKPVQNIKIFRNDLGEIIFEGESQNGIEVDRLELFEQINQSLNSENTNITIPFTETRAQVETTTEFEQMGIKELIGVGHTAFKGSPKNRVTNITVGASKYNGILLKPGETFSFNDNLGEVDAENGFVKELVIKKEGTIPEYGGGICQISSTIYKAALFSGLPIDERKAHSYAVAYYAQIDGYGLDSTIYQGVVDLKFTNDTGSYVLIQAYIKDTEAFVKFYGTSDGRQVRLEGPVQYNYRGAGGTQLIPTSTLPTGVKKQVERANSGFDVLWKRYITKDGEEKVEDIVSVYRATANKILVGE